MKNKKKKKYLITESIKVDFEIEAYSAEEARDLYFDAFQKTFNNSKLTCDDSYEVTCYQKTSEGWKKDMSI